MTITLTSMSSEETTKLFEFLQNQPPENKFWKAGKTYYFGEGNTSEITLSHDLLWRKRKGTKQGLRYEIITPQKLGDGSAGEIYQIAATLALDTETIQFKQAKSRVVKIQYHDDEKFTLDMLQNEYQSADKVGHLAIKEPTVMAISDISYTVMKKIKGIELFDIFKNDILLLPEQRLQLSKALLLALKQITDSGIIHRDIKPENILVDLTDPITVTIIDFGFGIPADSDDSRRCGTLNYAPPEVYEDTVVWSTKSDVFSMARVLGALWGDDLTYYTYSDINDVMLYASNVNYDSLFKDISSHSLNSTNRNIIRTTLTNMSQADINNRISIDEAIRAFNQITLASIESSPEKRDIDIQEQIQLILRHVAQLRLKAVNLTNRGYNDVSQAIYQLTNAIEFKTYNFKQLSEEERQNTIEDYTKSCKTVIDAIKPKLKNHRNINYIVANISLAIAGLGILYLLAISANKIITNNFFFFTTPKALGVAQDLEKGLDSFHQEIACCA
ncbi:MAG: protein kinase [Legionella sp.]|nr:protein kinase [Legionella sp.]